MPNLDLDLTSTGRRGTEVTETGKELRCKSYQVQAVDSLMADIESRFMEPSVGLA